MKKLLSNILFFLLIVFCSLNTKAQSQPLDSPLIEIFTLVEGNGSQNVDISFTLSAIGTVWKAQLYSTTENLFYLSNDVGGGTVTPPLNAPYYRYTGFNYSSMDDHSYPEFGFGLYKLQTSVGDYFYLDYRDTRYTFYNNCTGHCADIWIKYDIDRHGLYLKSHGTDNWSSYQIENGAYLKIWDIKGQISHSTIGVPDFWANSLAITQNTNNNPRLVWGPHPTFSTTNYKVYRWASNTSVSDPSTIPDSLFQLIYTSPNATTCNFTDNEIQIGSNGQNFYYFITASRVRTPKPSLESSKSNYVSVLGGMYKKGDREEEQKGKSFSFSLNQNYPNPFNPSTTISYQIPSNSFVTLKVYDVLGNEVSTLVSEWQEAGSYSAQFPTSEKQLASGMYFYTLTAGKFTDTKKFILMK